MEKNERALYRSARSGRRSIAGSHFDHALVKTATRIGSQFYRRFGKRTLDIVLAVVALPVLLPIFLIFYFIVRSDGGSFLYRHPRVGKDGDLFNCLKIRTMVVDSDAILQRVLEEDPARAEEWRTQYKLMNDPRVTRLGRVLRATALDELPQIFNVLKGEMSFVGPRPITRDELTLYGPLADKYVTARPGLTGTWQITDRRDNDYTSRARLDANYVERMSLFLDLYIVMATVPEMLFARGR